MIGQASHFMRYAPERHEYSIARYANECARLVNVLEYQLRRSEYVAGDYSIADMAIWPLANVVALVGIERSDYPAMDRWLGAIEQRPAVGRVFSNRETAVDQSYLRASRSLTAEEWSNTYGERMLAAAKAD
jgi:GST-like protein